MSIVGAAKKRRAQASVNGELVKIKGESDDAREKRMYVELKSNTNVFRILLYS
jgi:hypothetical protein